MSRGRPGRRLRCSLALFVLGAMSWSAADAVETITRADWPQIRQGDQLTRIPVLQRVMARFERLNDPQIIIRYPGGDRGNAWAVELRDWLVAMGVSSRRIALEPGSGAPAAMTVDVRDIGRSGR